MGCAPCFWCSGSSQLEWLLSRMSRAKTATGWHCLREVCGRVTTRVGIASSLPIDLGEFSVSPAWGGAPRATDGGCVLEVMNCDGEPGVAGEACHICSSAPLRFRLSGSSALVEGETSGTMSFGSTSLIGRSWVGSSAFATFQSGSSLKSNRSGLKLLFSHQPLYCSSCHTCNWCSQPQAFLLGKPLVMMPMCPSLEKGVWAMTLFILA